MDSNLVARVFFPPRTLWGDEWAWERGLVVLISVFPYRLSSTLLSISLFGWRDVTWNDLLELSASKLLVNLIQSCRNQCILKPAFWTSKQDWKNWKVMNSQFFWNTVSRPKFEAKIDSKVSCWHLSSMHIVGIEGQCKKKHAQWEFHLPLQCQTGKC